VPASCQLSPGGSSRTAVPAGSPEARCELMAVPRSSNMLSTVLVRGNQTGTSGQCSGRLGWPHRASVRAPALVAQWFGADAQLRQADSSEQLLSQEVRMPSYLSPGVYVEEVSSGSKPIEGVGTASPGSSGSQRRPG